MNLEPTQCKMGFLKIVNPPFLVALNLTQIVCCQCNENAIRLLLWLLSIALFISIHCGYLNPLLWVICRRTWNGKKLIIQTYPRDWAEYPGRHYAAACSPPQSSAALEKMDYGHKCPNLIRFWNGSYYTLYARYIVTQLSYAGRHELIN